MVLPREVWDRQTFFVKQVGDGEERDMFYGEEAIMESVVAKRFL